MSPMKDDWIDKYAREEAILNQKIAQRKAERDWFNGLGPSRLSEHVIGILNIPDKEDSNHDPLPERLRQQTMALDALFYTNLHEAGFGRQTKLDIDVTRLALDSQKQCRQTYDLVLKSAVKTPEIKKPKQTEG